MDLHHGICDCPITQEQFDELTAVMDYIKDNLYRFRDMGDGTIQALTPQSWSLGCDITLITRQGVIENWSSTNCLSIHPVPGKWKR
jgi:hypothetical protein